MKAQKCRLFLGTRYKMIDLGKFESKNKAKYYIKSLPYKVIYKII